MNKVQVVILSKSRNQTYCLLLQTNENRGSFWQNVTGSVEESDQDTHFAASREVLEETGLLEDKGQIWPLNYSFQYEAKDSVILTEECFLFLTEDCPPITITKQEHSNYKWLSVEDISLDSYQFESNYKAFQISLKKIGEL